MRKRIIQGISANFIGQVIHLASRVLLVPLFLKAWGNDIYGEWLILTSIAAYLSITDFGGQLYIVNRLTQLYACAQLDDFRRVLHTGMALFVVVPVILFVLFVSIVTWITPSTLGIVKTGNEVVLGVLLLLAFQFVIALPQGLILGVYRAVGQLPRGMMLANIAQLLQLIMISAALWLNVGMIGIAVIQTIPYIAIAALALIDLHRRFPQLAITSIQSADRNLARTFVRPSMHFFSLQISQLLTLQGSVLVVGALLGSVQVVMFTTIRTLANVAKQFLGMLSHSAWPEMTRLDAEGDKEKLFRLFRVILRSTLIMTMGFTILFHYWGENIYHLWLGDKVAYQSRIMDLFLVYLLQLTFWTACSHVLMATNNHRNLSRLLFVASIATLCFSFIGGQWLGLEGVLLGMILGDFLLPAWLVPYLLWKYYEKYSLNFYFMELWPICAGVMVAVVLPPASLPVIGLGLAWAINEYRSSKRASL